MTTVVNTNPFKPNQLKIISLGIGISDETNDTLRLTDTQHLVVAERQENVAGNTVSTYGLIVDREGIAVNTTMIDRAAVRGQYAMYVDGSVFVSGAIIACNIVSGNGNISTGIGVATSNFWTMGTREVDNIFYPGHVTLGNDRSSRSNAHPLNIVQSADRTINHAQISIQNTALSQLRMGIIGTSNASPALFNTRPGVPIEFHASRDATYFEDVYKRHYYENGVRCNIAAEVPRYDSPDTAPHLCIDVNGNVGIHTANIPRFTFEVRKPNPLKPTEVLFPWTTEDMNLAVAGNMFASNILIWDYENGRADNIDRLYVRRKGITMEANQVIPGPFALGEYRFLSNVAINGPTESDFELVVHGDQHITDRLVVDRMAKVGLLEASDAILLDIASFCNDVYINRDVIVKESLRLRGGLFTEVIDGNNVYWCNVQFTVAQPGFQNINYIGSGFTTPGRAGIGIDPETDEVNNQLVVRKRLSDIWELELMDKGSQKLHKAAFIGHPQTDAARVADGSLVFATPGSKDPDYNRDNVYPDAPQNFYFYPGYYTFYAEPIVRQDNPPVLNVHTKKRVGVLTFDPQTELDVRGSVSFTGEMFNGANKVGLWTEKKYANIYQSGGTNPTFVGIEYYRPDSSNVGVNIPADPRYGMVVAGKLKSIDGFYTADDQRVVPWMDSVTSANIVAPRTAGGMFTFNNVGIGIRNPSVPLEIKNNYGQYTTMRFIRPDGGDVEPISTIEFTGLYNPWIIRANDDAKTLEFGYGSNAFLGNGSKRAMWMTQSLSGKHQVVIGGDLNTLNTQVRQNHPQPEAALTVDGGLAVFGDVSITGKYVINGRELVNSNIYGDNTIQLNNDDVFIAGDRVLVNPKRMLAVGYTAERLVSGIETNDRTFFRVYQPDSTVPNIARFTCAGNNGLIEIASTAPNGQAVRLGFFGNSAFSILNSRNVPFLSFNSNLFTGENNMAVNNVGGPASANMHVQTTGTGSNMLRLTRLVAGDDTTRLAPQIEVEKRVTTSAGLKINRWVWHGPDASFDQKLGLRYGEGEIGNSSEMFCFTKTGCFGIGNTTPEFALDVTATGKRGSLRLYNGTNSPVPQVIFQNGSNLYGADEATDYRFYSFSNNFVLDSVNRFNYTKLLHFNEYNTVGICTDATSNYTLNVGGSLNVAKTIFLDGSPLFDTEGSSAQEGFNVRAINIFFRPRTDYAGGVHINRTAPSSNLFHINAGFNKNIAVFDSTFNEAQVHFRTATAVGSEKFSIYRLAQSNEMFTLEHMPNSSNAPYIPDTHTGYSNVIQWGPSPRLSGEYDVNLYGSMNLVSTLPQIKLASSTIGQSNGHMYMMPVSSSNVPCHVGIGTTVPTYKLHVFTSNSVPAFGVVQQGTANILELSNSNAMRMVVTHQGNLGIGTTNPLRKVHIQGGDLYIVSGVATAPSFTFTASPNTGLLNPATDVLTIQTASQERMRITNTGLVGIGTQTPQSTFHVSGSNTTSTCTLVQDGVGDILRVVGASNNNKLVVTSSNCVGINKANPVAALDIVGNQQIAGHILPSQDVTFNLGSVTQRWKDLFLSGNTIDLGGTSLSRTSNGDVKLLDVGSNALRSIVCKQVQIGDDSALKQLLVRQGATDPIVFVDVDNLTQAETEYVPFLKSSATSGISVGVQNPEALLHVVGHDVAPTAIFDHDNPNALNVFQLRDNGIPILTANKGGNIGIGTQIASAPLHVWANNSTNSVILEQANSFGNIVTLRGTKPIVVNGFGNVGIGTELAMVPLHVRGSQLFDGGAVFKENVYMAKNLEVQGDNVVHGDQTTDSDIRLKTDLERIENALDKVASLSGYTFMKQGQDHRSTGLVAQEVAKVLPEAVIENKDTGYLSVAYGNMMGIMVEAIKELKQQLDDIKKKVNA
jgi:hypothetical protein